MSWYSTFANYSLYVTVFRFGQEYSTLKARVLKTLCEATAADKPLPTIYGGIVGVTLFGPKAVDAFLLPLVIPYFTKWQQQLDTTRSLERTMELQACQQAILVRIVLLCQSYITNVITQYANASLSCTLFLFLFT